MIDRLLEHIAPHLCCGCGKVGTLLCDNCEYDIILNETVLCIACGNLARENGICESCILPYQKGWFVGERSGELKRLIDGLKFEHKKSAGSTLARLLDQRMPHLPNDVVVVPIPTTADHIRQRGYDHTRLIALHFAKSRQLNLIPALIRKTTTVQRGHNKKERFFQADQAFALHPRFVPKNIPYLLVDDVVTTGATLRAAANVLRASGVETVWVAALALQPLD